MTTPQFRLLEVWSDLQCAGGAALGAVLDPSALGEVRRVRGEETLELELPRGSTAWQHLLERRILRTTFSDGSFDEWRITSLEERREQGAIRSVVKAVWPSADLGTLAPISRLEADGTVRFDFDGLGLTLAQHLSNFILPALSGAGATWFAAGTIDPTAPFDFRYAWTTPLTACLQLAEDAGVEFRLRRNGTTQYLLDFLTQIGSAAPRLYIQLGKNLLGAKRQRSADPQATRVYPRGAVLGDGIRATIADALWKVASAPTSTTARLVDPNGGAGPIAFNDQLNWELARPIYVRKWPSGSWILVTDSAVANHEITTTSAHGFVADDLVQFAHSSTGKQLTYLDAYPAVDGSLAGQYGIIHKILDRPNLPDTVNVIPNPAMRTYSTGSNAPPDGWAVIPGCGLSVNNVDREQTAGRWRFGGQSAKVVTGGDGQGIETGYAAIAPTDLRPYFSGFLSFWNETDGAKLKVDIVAGIATVSISSGSRTGGGPVTVTVNTGSAHGLAVGDQVEVLGVVGGTVADGYNGIQTVSEIVDSDTFKYQLDADPGTFTPSSATMRKVWKFSTPGDPRSKRWIDFGVAGMNFKQLATTVAKVRVMQDGSTGATVYVDCAQLTQTDIQRPFIEGSGAVALWQHANHYLLLNSQPAVSVEVDLVDLARLDSTTWAADDITLGGPVDLDDPEWAADISTRVVEVSRNLLVEGATRIGLSSRPEDLTDETVRPQHPPRPIPEPPIIRRVRRTVHLQGSEFIGDSSVGSGSHAVWNQSGLTATDTGLSAFTASLSGDPRFRGAILKSFRVKFTIAGGAVTGVWANLYKNTTLEAAVAQRTASGLYGMEDGELSLAITGSDNIWLSFNVNNSTATGITLEYLDVDVEIDEVVERG